MAGTGPSNVNAAFDMLLDEIKAHIAVADLAGATAFQAGDYDAVTNMAVRAKSMKDLMTRAAALRDEWDTLGGPAAASGGIPKPRPKPIRPSQGARIHVDDFRVPLLKALEERGGKAPKAEVLRRVEEMLRDRLGPIEYTPIPSSPDRIRWSVRAEWVRFRLTQEGLMKNDSPRGNWEISDAGRQHLANSASSTS